MKKNNRAGFSLTELLVAIAIIGILAGVVLVSMSSYGKKARASKALAQLSSAIPGMVSCWGNGYDVSESDSNGGECICKNGSNCVDSYGKWPDWSGGGLANYSFLSGTNVGDSKDWFIRAYSDSNHDDVSICCNDNLGGCKITGDASVRNSGCGLATPVN